MIPSPRRLSSLVLLVAIVLVAAGCGGTVIDDAKTEGAIQHNLETSLKKDVESVDCPSGIDVEAGETFDCAVRLKGGEEETATLKILNEDADVELVDLKPAG